MSLEKDSWKDVAPGKWILLEQAIRYAVCAVGL